MVKKGIDRLVISIVNIWIEIAKISNSSDEIGNSSTKLKKIIYAYYKQFIYVDNQERKMDYTHNVFVCNLSYSASIFQRSQDISIYHKKMAHGTNK